MRFVKENNKENVACVAPRSVLEELNRKSSKVAGSEHMRLFHISFLTFCLSFPVPVCHWGKTPAGEGLCLIVVDQNPDY